MRHVYISEEGHLKARCVFCSGVEDLIWLQTHEMKCQGCCNPFPYKEGDDYYTFQKDGNYIIWSCWDEHSEEAHKLNPDRKYYDSVDDVITGEYLGYGETYNVYDRNSVYKIRRELG